MTVILWNRVFKHKISRAKEIYILNMEAAELISTSLHYIKAQTKASEGIHSLYSSQLWILFYVIMLTF